MNSLCQAFLSFFGAGPPFLAESKAGAAMAISLSSVLRLAMILG